MILVIMRMKVTPEKRLELLQAIVSLTRTIRTKKGCRRCDFLQSLGNENELCLIEKWDTPEDFRAHLKSEHFKVLRGAMNLLQEPCDQTFYTVIHSAGGGGDLKVKSLLAADDFLKSIEISVETYKGIVQLSGFVDSQMAVDSAGDIARGVQGVKSVKNNLNVKK
jgi:quinol monooxygenase YgiN